MKKRIILALLLCLAMCVSLFAVGCNDATDDPDDGKNDAGENNNGDDSGNGDDGQNNDGGNDDGNNNKDPEKIYFNIIFTDAEGNPLKGVMAGICIGDQCASPARSGDDGKVKLTHSQLTADSTDINLNVISVPEGYVVPDGYIKLSLEKLDDTVVLEKAASDAQ